MRTRMVAVVMAALSAAWLVAETHAEPETPREKIQRMQADSERLAREVSGYLTRLRFQQAEWAELLTDPANAVWLDAVPGDDPSDGGGDDDGDDDGDTSPPDGGGAEQGWTELVPSDDTLIYYLSQNGDDSNDGLSEDAPLRTLNAGYAKLRNGSADWLLFERGDTFDGFGRNQVRVSGRSPEDPIVFGAYGDESLPRPKLVFNGRQGLDIHRVDARRNLAFVSLELVAGDPQPEYGVTITTSERSGDILFEDLKITGFRYGMSLRGMDKVRIRRCVIADNGGNTRSQGIIAVECDGLLIEGCVIDHNGLATGEDRDDRAEAEAHNVYIQRGPQSRGLVFVDNFVSRAEAHGLQARDGGIVDRNVFWRNPMAVMFGNEGLRDDELPVPGSCNDNLILESINLTSDDLRGWGIQVQNADGVTVSRNIIANSLTHGDGWGLMFFTGRPPKNRNLTAERNFVYQHGRAIEIRERNVESIAVRGNQFFDSTGSTELTSIAGVVYEDNSLTRTDLRGDDLILTKYAASIGMRDADELVSAMRDQRKGNWDQRLTTGAIRAWADGVIGGTP